MRPCRSGISSKAPENSTRMKARALGFERDASFNRSAYALELGGRPHGDGVLLALVSMSPGASASAELGWQHESTLVIEAGSVGPGEHPPHLPSQPLASPWFSK